MVVGAGRAVLVAKGRVARESGSGAAGRGPGPTRTARTASCIRLSGDLAQRVPAGQSSATPVAVSRKCLITDRRYQPFRGRAPAGFTHHCGTRETRIQAQSTPRASSACSDFASRPGSVTTCASGGVIAATPPLVTSNDAVKFCKRLVKCRSRLRWRRLRQLVGPPVELVSFREQLFDALAHSVIVPY